MKKIFKYLIYFIILIALAFFITGKINQTSIQKGSLEFTDKWQGEFINIGGEKIWSQPKVFYAISNEQVNYLDDLNEISSEYKNINKKVSILIGDKDRENTIADCKRLKNDIPNADITFLKNTAHYIQLEQTNELINVILKHSNE